MEQTPSSTAKYISLAWSVYGTTSPSEKSKPEYRGTRWQSKSSTSVLTASLAVTTDAVAKIAGESPAMQTPPSKGIPCSGGLGGGAGFTGGRTGEGLGEYLTGPGEGCAAGAFRSPLLVWPAPDVVVWSDLVLPILRCDVASPVAKTTMRAVANAIQSLTGTSTYWFFWHPQWRAVPPNRPPSSPEERHLVSPLLSPYPLPRTISSTGGQGGHKLPVIRAANGGREAAVPGARFSNGFDLMS